MQLHATQLILTPMAQVRLKITDPYSIHRVVMDLFPRRYDDQGMELSSSIQWVDCGERIFGREIRILSNVSPNIQEVKNSAVDDIRVTTNPIPESFFDKEYYRFSLIANPFICKLSGKRVPIMDELGVGKWIDSKAEKSGFVIIEKEIDKIRPLIFNKGKNKITLHTARISGVLKVQDKERFVEAVGRGIGKGRAWGLGLMQLSIKC